MAPVSCPRSPLLGAAFVHEHKPEPSSCHEAAVCLPAFAIARECLVDIPGARNQDRSSRPIAALRFRQECQAYRQALRAGPSNAAAPLWPATSGRGSTTRFTPALVAFANTDGQAAAPWLVFLIGSAGLPLWSQSAPGRAT